MPKKIIGFYSSALYNIKTINENIEAFYIKTNAYEKPGRCYEKVLNEKDIKCYPGVRLNCKKYI